MSEELSLDLSSEQLVLIREILLKHVPKSSIGVFGSRVTGKAKPFSDLDLAVMGDHPLPMETLATLAEAFSDSALPWKVDIVDWASITDDFRQIIKQRYVMIQDKGENKDAAS